MKTQKIPKHQHPKLWAVLPAAGTGSRFSKDQLKQYQLIDHQTVLEHTVQALSHLQLSGCVLAIAANDHFAPTLHYPTTLPMHYCAGGAERVHSVLNALYHLKNFADLNDWVLVHDAARPCVRAESLSQLVEHCLNSNRSAILATPVRDTLKRVSNAQEVVETVDRSQLWQAQTPQMAPLGVLIAAIEHALKANHLITDEASALEYAGVAVDVVMGSADNLKITYSEDLILAQMIFQLRQQHP